MPSPGRAPVCHHTAVCSWLAAHLPSLVLVSRAAAGSKGSSCGFPLRMPETARVSDVGDELALVPCASATADGVPGGAGCSDDDSIDGDLLLGVYAVPCEHEHAPGQMSGVCLARSGASFDMPH